MLNDNEVRCLLIGHKQLCECCCFTSAFEMIIKLNRKASQMPSPFFLQEQFGCSISEELLNSVYPDGVCGFRFIEHKLKMVEDYDPYFTQMLEDIETELAQQHMIIIATWSWDEGHENFNIHAHVVYCSEDNPNKRYRSVTAVENRESVESPRWWTIEELWEHMRTPWHELCYWTYS